MFKLATTLLQGNSRNVNIFLPVFIVWKLTMATVFRYVSNITIISKPIFTETRTQEIFGLVTLILAVSSPKQTAFCLAPFGYHTLFPTRNKDAFFGVTLFVCYLPTWGVGTILSCLLLELQEPPSSAVDLRNFSGVGRFWDLFRYQGLSMPSLVHIGVTYLGIGVRT
jgi:hypothetical protein